MKTETKSVVLSRALTLGVVGVVALSLSDASLAGTGGEAFDDVWSTLTDWTQGTLGRIIAGSMVLVGIVGGIARQSLMAFALGVGGGMGLYNTPTVVESVMSATLPVVAELPVLLVDIPPAILLATGGG
jgi:conjugal transfer pilus assembly protein TraA